MSSNAGQAAFEPPFDEIRALFTQVFPQRSSKCRLFLPAAYFQNDEVTKSMVLQTINPIQPDSFRQYLKHELDVSRLNKIHKHLWFAGLPGLARPLHHQIAKGRKITITENADCHLLWQDDVILIKPLPPFLMDYEVWVQHLCQDRGLFETANGFLLSYVWLICHESDLKIAHEAGLLSDEFYGELRLGRLNTIYRWCSATTKFSTFIRGYNYGYTTYTTFFQRNTAWLLVAVVYITVVLTAMQVGLATHQLKDNAGFNRASYGFTVFSILAPLIVVTGMVLILLVLIIFNLLYTLGKQKKKRTEFPVVFQNETLQVFKH